MTGVLYLLIGVQAFCPGSYDSNIAFPGEATYTVSLVRSRSDYPEDQQYMLFNE